MILVLNPGSSSLKYKLFDGVKVIKSDDFEINKNDDDKNFEATTERVLAEIKDYWGEVDKIGIRVVHGGKEYCYPTKVDENVISNIKKTSDLAPLHNPAALSVIQKLYDHNKNIPIYCVFDTAFFCNLPEENRIYAIDQKIAEKLEIKRYGFHGISHQYASEKADLDHKDRIIVIHLGSGSSVSAVNQGQPIATSMGMTPLEGLVMQTRCGDIDPGIVLFLVEKLGLSDAKKLFQKNSGLSGLTGTDGSMVKVLEMAGERVEGAEFNGCEDTSRSTKEGCLALKIYVNQIIKYIGAYTALLGGVDKIVFTGKIGARSRVIRDMVMKKIEFLCKEVVVVEPDEELAIAEKLNRL